MAPRPGDTLNRPLFIAAVAVATLVVVVELGLGHLIGGGPAGRIPRAIAEAQLDPDFVDLATKQAASTPPGAGIRYLALVDGLLLFTLLLLGSSLVVAHRAYGRAQGIVTLVVSLVWILTGLVLAIAAFVTLMVMIGLFVATPFGTIAYVAIWGFFPVGEATVVLGLLLVLKIALGALLVASQRRFILVKGLVALLVVSVLLQMALGFIHQFLPGVLVSIGDQLWALVTAVVAIVWAIIMLIGAIPAVVNALRVSGSVND